MKSSLALIAIALGANVAQASPLGFDNARHLLNRAQFSASVQEIEAFAKLDRNEAADRLLRGKIDSAAARPPEWVNEKIVPPREIKAMSEEERKAVRKEMIEKSFELREWWFNEMLATRSPLTEKMTLFWHNHFATSQRKVRFPQLMYRQNVLFRTHALGNFAPLLREVARDPAMIVFLDSATNRKGQPNENFARELMELFTLGEGHYSERDVKEAARAFTGWSIEPETGGDEVFDILLAHPRTAEFVTEKLWREFISPESDADEVERLGESISPKRL